MEQILQKLSEIYEKGAAGVSVGVEGRSQKVYERTFLGEGRYDKGVLSFLLQAQKYPMVFAIF